MFRCGGCAGKGGNGLDTMEAALPREEAAMRKKIADELTSIIPKHLTTAEDLQNFYNDKHTYKEQPPGLFKKLGSELYSHIYHDLDVVVAESVESGFSSSDSMVIKTKKDAEKYGLSISGEFDRITLSPFQYAMALGKKHIVKLFSEHQFDYGDLLVAAIFERRDMVPDYNIITKPELFPKQVSHLLLLAYKHGSPKMFAYFVEYFAELLKKTNEPELLFYIMQDLYEDQAYQDYCVQVFCVKAMQVGEMGLSLRNEHKVESSRLLHISLWVRGWADYYSKHGVENIGKSPFSARAYQVYVLSLIDLEKLGVGIEEGEYDVCMEERSGFSTRPQDCLLRLDDLYQKQFNHKCFTGRDCFGSNVEGEGYSPAQIKFLQRLFEKVYEFNGVYKTQVDLNVLQIVKDEEKHTGNGFVFQRAGVKKDISRQDEEAMGRAFGDEFNHKKSMLLDADGILNFGL